jgi:hypothetical protein
MNKWFQTTMLNNVNNIKQYKNCDFYLKREDFIDSW